MQLKTPKRASAPRRAAATAGVCRTFYVDDARVARVLYRMPDAQRTEEMAQLFGVLSNPTRVRLLYALAREELCVCDLARVVDRSLSGTSHQLSLLRQQRLVSYRMEGKLAYYRLAEPWVARMLQDALARTDREAA